MRVNNACPGCGATWACGAGCILWGINGICWTTAWPEPSPRLRYEPEDPYEELGGEG